MKTFHQPGLVSIALAAYNVERIISASIESVLAQTYSDWELIIVNDGSSDQTAIQAARYSDSRIKLIHQSKCGEATAYNTALRHLRGEYIAFLSPGDVFLPQHLELGVAEILTYPVFDGLLTEGVIRDEKGNFSRLLADQFHFPDDGYIFGEVIKSKHGFGSATGILLRRSLVTRFQLQFDPDIQEYSLWDFLIQFSELGRFGFIRQPTYHSSKKISKVSQNSSGPQLALSLARCCEKAIKLDAFPKLEEATRSQVFYELLVIHLVGYLHHQDQVTLGNEFSGLSVAEQARLLRLIAYSGLIYDKNNQYTEKWLARAKELYPADRQSAYQVSLLRFNPWLFRMSLHLRHLLHLRLS